MPNPHSASLQHKQRDRLFSLTNLRFPNLNTRKKSSKSKKKKTNLESVSPYLNFIINISSKTLNSSLLFHSYNKKSRSVFRSDLISFLIFRGLFQIRTGVNGFADRCLATRPRDLLVLRLQRYVFFYYLTNLFSLFFVLFSSFADLQQLKQRKRYLFSRNKNHKSEVNFSKSCLSTNEISISSPNSCFIDVTPLSVNPQGLI